MVLGLASGLFYREYVKATDSLGTHTQLNTLHTHLLVLGMIMFLLVLALDAIFSLSGRRSFDVFYWTYNIGLVRSEEHTSELQSRGHLVCRLLLEKKKQHMQCD